MMTCAQLDALLERYLAGRLPAVEADALEFHAADCARCAPLLERATRIDWSLPRDIAPPPVVRDRLMATIGPKRAASPPLPRWFIPAIAAATVLIVLNLGAPPSKSGQAPVKSPSSTLANERADRQFKELDAAAAELTAALREAPDDADLKAALSRIDARRKALHSLIKEYET